MSVLSVWPYQHPETWLVASNCNSLADDIRTDKLHMSLSTSNSSYNAMLCTKALEPAACLHPKTIQGGKSVPLNLPLATSRLSSLLIYCTLVVHYTFRDAVAMMALRLAAALQKHDVANLLASMLEQEFQELLCQPEAVESLL